MDEAIGMIPCKKWNKMLFFMDRLQLSTGYQRYNICRLIQIDMTTFNYKSFHCTSMLNNRNINFTAAISGLDLGFLFHEIYL